MWLGLAFLSAALLGMYDVFKKMSVKGNAVIPVLFLNTLFCSLFFLPLIVGSSTGHIAPDSPFYIPFGGWHTQLLIILKALLVLASWLAGYYGIKHLPLTIAGPIHATRPLMVLLGALVIFGEKLNFLQWAGVLVAIFSFYMLSRSGRKEGIHFAHNRWIWLVVLASFLGAMSGLYDKYLLAPHDAGGAGINQMSVQSWFNFYQCLTMLLILLLVWRPTSRTTSPFTWRWSIPLVSLFLTSADLLYFRALTLDSALISVVSMIRRGSVIVSFIMGAWLFHESNLKSKAIDLTIVILSMILLWLGSK